MNQKFNTIALAYVNEDEEIVAWSADIFGSPRDYPKTYKDTPKNRDTLAKKFDPDMKFLRCLSKNFSSVNCSPDFVTLESAISDQLSFKSKNITGYKIMKLELISDYSNENYSPIWKDIKRAIDEKLYKDVNVKEKETCSLCGRNDCFHN